jgi:hypothetical protein
MRTAWATYPIEVTGGLITNLPPLQQGMNSPGSAASLVNMEASIEGGYKKIYGYAKWTTHGITSASQMQGVIALSPLNAIAVVGGKYYKSTNKGAWVEKLDSSLTPGGKVRHVTYDFVGLNKVIMVNGATKPIIYNPIADTIVIDSGASSDVVGASYVTEFKNHIFFGVGTNLVFTAPFTDDDYAPGNGAGIINVGSTITGLIVFREQLVIFSEDSIHIMSGSSSSDFIVAPITRKTGCINGDTIQEIGGDILYLGPDGVRFLSATDRNNDFALERASENIQKDFLTLYSGSGDWCSTVIRSKNQYRIFKWDPAGSRQAAVGYTATRFIDQSASGMSWSRLSGIRPYMMDSKQFGDQEVILFVSAPISGVSYVYQLESGNSFDGSNIPFLFKTPDIPISDPRIRKTFYKITVYTTAEGPNQFNLGSILDSDRAGIVHPPTQTIQLGSGTSFAVFSFALFGTDVFSGDLDAQYTINTTGSGFTISVVLSGSDTLDSFAVDTILIEYSEEDRK